MAPAHASSIFTGISTIKAPSPNRKPANRNIRRDEFRLVMAVHFDRARVHTLRFMTHAEHDRNQWKQDL